MQAVCKGTGGVLHQWMILVGNRPDLKGARIIHGKQIIGGRIEGETDIGIRVSDKSCNLVGMGNRDAKLDVGIGLAE